MDGPPVEPQGGRKGPASLEEKFRSLNKSWAAVLEDNEALKARIRTQEKMITDVAYTNEGFREAVIVWSKKKANFVEEIEGAEGTEGTDQGAIY